MDGWLPGGKMERRGFIALVALTCALLLLGRFALAPLLGTDPPSAATVVDATLGDILATAAAGTLLAFGLLWLYPPPKYPAIIDNVFPHEITLLLESGLQDTQSWWFDGSTGRYLRAAVLPRLAAAARQEGMGRAASVVLLDPTDEELCEHYASYRSGLNSQPAREWSAHAVRQDIYATILAAQHYARSTPLDVTVGLKRTMSILRYDLCDSQIVVTKEGRKDPAIRCPRDSFFYRAYFEDLRLSLRQSRRLQMGPKDGRRDWLDRDEARQALRQMGVYEPMLDDDQVVDAILAEARSEQHPYA